MSWENELQEKYHHKGSFSHASPKCICLFPYTTSPVTQKIIEELKSFFIISGETLRDLSQVENDVECNSSSILTNIKDKIETKNFTDLQHIIKVILFNERGLIHCFHPIIFYHLASQTKQKSITTLAHFTRDVLFEDHTELGPDTSVENDPTNIFYSLILQTLPPLNSRKSKRVSRFYKAQDPLHKCFIKDCSFLKEDDQFFASNLPELLKFYFFIYQVRLVERLNLFFNNPAPQPFYFSVNWESLSKGRQAFQEGWKRIEPKLATMFSHAHCLEMLNSVPIEGLTPPFTYSEIKNWQQNASPATKRQAIVDINSLINFYKEGIEQLKFNWNTFNYRSDHHKSIDKELENRIVYFYKMVHFQFEHSNRKAAAARYGKWLSQFAANNFLKQRGPLGNTLCLSRDQLLFLTRLCIGNRPEAKLRLTELWIEFSKRGVAFDFETQKQILALFNQLNLIEKKSDSGDAQYVRAIF